MAQHDDPTTSPNAPQVAGPVTSMPDSFRNVPLEIAEHILKYLPDVDSVANMRLSCRRLNQLFCLFETPILEAVLCNELGGPSHLHTEAIKALRVPVHSNIAKDLTKLVWVLPCRCPLTTPNCALVSFFGLPGYAGSMRQLTTAVRGASSPPEEEDRDPTTGPYSMKRALEALRVRQAHQQLTGMFLAFSTTKRRRDPSWQPPSREAVEIALWHVEHFCRVFANQLWFKRWHPSVVFARIIDTYWYGRTRAEAAAIEEVHTFLSALVWDVVHDIRVCEEGPCPHAEPSEALWCTPCIKRSVEGAISTGLVGILMLNSGISMSSEPEHPFFLGAFIEGNLWRSPKH